MTLDHSPAPGAATARSRVLRHARTEATLLLRNGEQLLLALVIPLALLLGGRWLTTRVWLDPRVFPASVLALAVFSSTFTSLAIATAFERRYGVLERLAATPLGRTGLLLGKALAIGSIAVAQVVLLALVAVVLGWRPAVAPLPWLLALGTVVAASVAFASLALAMAGRLRAEAVLGLANLLYVVLAGVGAVVIPLSVYPGILPAVVRWLPTAALGEALRAAATGQLLGWPLLVAAVWAVVGVVVCRKVFRWIQ